MMAPNIYTSSRVTYRSENLNRRHLRLRKHRAISANMVESGPMASQIVTARNWTKIRDIESTGATYSDPDWLAANDVATARAAGMFEIDRNAIEERSGTQRSGVHVIVRSFNASGDIVAGDIAGSTYASVQIHEISMLDGRQALSIFSASSGFASQTRDMITMERRGVEGRLFVLYVLGGASIDLSTDRIRFYARYG